MGSKCLCAVPTLGVSLMLAMLGFGVVVSGSTAFAGVTVGGGDSEGGVVQIASCAAHAVRVVDTLTDENDGSDQGEGQSLRDAIAEAGTEDVIVFDPALGDGRIVLSLGVLNIADSLTIDGDVDGDGVADITLDANNASGIIEYNNGNSRLRVQHLNFENGASGSSTIYQAAGDLEVLRCTFSDNEGGGIFKNYATFSNRLVVADCLFQRNSGVAIFSTATGVPGTEHTVIENCTFFYNNASSGGALYLSSGGARYPYRISKCRFQGNTANLGGAIYMVTAAGTIQDCTFLGNGSFNTYHGGAIHVFDAVGDLNISNCLFSLNYATAGVASGGALYVEQVGSIANVNIVQSSFTQNEASSSGAAVQALGSGGVSMSFKYCTLVYNLLDSGSGWAIAHDGGVSVDLDHTIVSFYSPNDPPFGDLIVGGFTSLGYNMFGGFTIPGAIGTDILGGDLDSGSITPGPASDALDAGDPTLVAGQNGLPLTDSLLNTRITGSAIDIGAIERDAPPYPGPTVTSITRLEPAATSDPCVQFQITFSEAVDGVLLADLAASMTDTLVGAVVESVEATAADTYTVTVSTGAGAGTLGLVVRDDDSIVGLASRVPLGGIGDGNGDYTSGETYTIVAPLVGDLDEDGDVDLIDFSHLSLCFAGPSQPPSGNCEAGIDSDLDDDGHVDFADYVMFEPNFVGPQ